MTVSNPRHFQTNTGQERRAVERLVRGCLSTMHCDPRLSPNNYSVLFLILKSVCWVNADSSDSVCAKWNCRLAVFSTSTLPQAGLSSSRTGSPSSSKLLESNPIPLVPSSNTTAYVMARELQLALCAAEGWETICSWPVLAVNSEWAELAEGGIRRRQHTGVWVNPCWV